MCISLFFCFDHPRAAPNWDGSGWAFLPLDKQIVCLGNRLLSLVCNKKRMRQLKYMHNFPTTQEVEVTIYGDIFCLFSNWSFICGVHEVLVGGLGLRAEAADNVWATSCWIHAGKSTSGSSLQQSLARQKLSERRVHRTQRWAKSSRLTLYIRAKFSRRHSNHIITLKNWFLHHDRARFVCNCTKLTYFFLFIYFWLMH